MYPSIQLSMEKSTVSTAEIFNRERYVLVQNFLAEPDLSKLFRYACKLDSAFPNAEGDEQIPGSLSAYGDFMMEGLLTSLLPQVEEASGLSLFPTYSYFRVYRNGDILKRHRDRFSCEVSLSLCLGTSDGVLWPIWIEGPQGCSEIQLSPGDALLYRGIECAHWRDAYRGSRLAQVFLHYVDQNGPHSEWKFDRRHSVTEVPGSPFGKEFTKTGL